MALVTRDDDAPPERAPNPIRVSSPQYRGVTVDTRYTPASALLTAMEGSAWVVNYYQQVIDDDNGLNGQIVSREAAYQQYRLIRKFELRVQSPLSHTQDDDNKEMRLVGSAHVYPHLTPNVGDMFLADVGDGREGVFRITTSERKSLWKDTVHFIEYELADYITPERLADFQRKTIRTHVFVKDFNYYGQDPFIEEGEYHTLRELERELRVMTQSYFTLFFSEEFQSLMLPGQPAPIYDHFLTQAVRRTFDTSEHIHVQSLRLMNISDDKTMRAINLWDAIVARDPRYLPHAFERASVTSVLSFTRDALMHSIFHSGYSYIVYPLDNEVSVDYLQMHKQKATNDDVLRDAPSKAGSLEVLIANTALEGLPYGETPLIKSVLTDDYYVLSEAFYTNAAGQSKFELAVRDFIHQRPVNRKLLKTFCETYYAWGGLERFYYTPILIMMIKSALKGA